MGSSINRLSKGQAEVVARVDSSAAVVVPAARRSRREPKESAQHFPQSHQCGGCGV